MEHEDRLKRIQDAKVGSAKVHIQHLRGKGIREIDNSNVKRLLAVFASDGCDRLEPAYRVPVVVSNEEITSILISNSMEVTSLRGAKPPKLTLNDTASLQCLRGQHRLAAGQEFFSEHNEQWWGVDIYRAEGLSRFFDIYLQLTLEYLRPIKE